jgi:undecaprenyl-diphosphatase
MFTQASFYLNSFLFKNTLFDFLIYFFSNILPFIMVFLVIGFFVVKKRSLENFLLTSFLALTSWGLSEILKHFFSKERPFVRFEEINPLFLITSTDSFPSGHSMVMASLATLMYFENKKFGTIFFILAALIGLARVFAGVHFLGDILFGYFFGVVFMIFSYKYFKKLKNKS